MIRVSDCQPGAIMIQVDSVTVCLLVTVTTAQTVSDSDQLHLRQSLRPQADPDLAAWAPDGDDCDLVAGRS